jgi:photosystem II stability/assembly factor-like uncharacterized protein
MISIPRPRIALALALALLTSALAASGTQAASWTEVASNTTEDITAVEYQSADRFWFATGAGRVFRRVGGVFQQEAFVPGAAFKDIEFQDGGLVGFAVGTNGTVLRSTDGGDNWAQVTGLAGGSTTSPNNCGISQAIGDVDSIRFAGNARAWLFGAGSQVFRTRDGATAANVGAIGGWDWINNNAGACRISGDVDDAFPIPGTNAIYFAGKSFGEVFFSANALTSTAARKPGSAGNGFQATRRLAGDPGNSNRMWAVTPEGEGGSYYQRTTDGWNTASDFRIANPDTGTLTRAEGVDFNGGTVLAAGSAGMIIVSVDGTNFYFDPVGGAVATQDWTSVSLASANDAAVGGSSGKLLLSANATAVPIPVTPPVTPPTTPGGGSGPFIPVLPAHPAGPPRIGLPSVFDPPVTGGTARVGRRFVSVPVSGRLTPPRGVSAATACRGKSISLKLSKTRGRRRTLIRTSVRVSRTCRYRKLLRVRRSRVSGARALLLQVSFRGSSVVGASRATYTLPVV